MENKYTNRVVAFIDILGFTALVKSLETDATLHKKLHFALERIKDFKASSIQKNTAQTNLEVSVFSDSIVISSVEEDFHSVIWSAIHLQSQLLSLGILARGGISSGKTIHENDILYGDGMLNAYHLESQAAVYPRIIIDDSVLKLVNQNYPSIFFSQDFDGMWYLDPFSIGILTGDASALVEDGWDPHEVALDKLEKDIAHSLATLFNEGQKAKWNWLKLKLELARVEFKKYGQPRYWHLIAAAHENT